MRARLLAIALLLSACSGSPFSYRSPGPYEGGPLLGTGSYFVEVWYRPGPGAEELRFNAVFARRSDASLFNAVTPAGKPLLRVRDTMSFAAPPELRAYPNELKLGAEPLAAFYGALRPVILLDDSKAAGAPVLERYPDGRPRLVGKEGASARIDEYDWEGHAFRLELEGKGWSARASLREYDIAR